MITRKDIALIVAMVLIAIVVNMIMKPTEGFAAGMDAPQEALDNIISMINSGTLTSTNLHLTGDANIEGSLNLLPKGIIVAWGSDTIPAGWALCDGNNGTPDLTGKFIFGSNKNRKLNSTGGAENVTLSVSQIPSHSHNLKVGKGDGHTNVGYVDQWDTKIIIGSKPGYISNTGGGKPHENMPPYTALNFIMKL
jgi:microcystin-dependent protein